MLTLLLMNARLSYSVLLGSEEMLGTPVHAVAGAGLGLVSVMDMNAPLGFWDPPKHIILCDPKENVTVA